MLCERCQKIQIPDKENGKIRSYRLAEFIHHPTHRSFYTAVKDGCYVCRSIWQELWLRRNDGIPDDVPEHFPQFVSGLALKKQRKSMMLLNWCLDEFGLNMSIQRHHASTTYTISHGFKDYLRLTINVFSRFPPGVSFLAIPVSPEIEHSIPTVEEIGDSTHHSMQHCRRWLTQCENGHRRCHVNSQPMFLPTRLVEITTDASTQAVLWRLVNTSGLAQSISYATLSHCWGSSIHTQLRAETEDTLKNPTPSSTLPKSFRDAIQIATFLGISYIWIDSLCIFQDSKVDWETEASRMRDVYSNARCNIAATWASNGDQGCFSQRDPMMLYPPLLISGAGGQKRMYQLCLSDLWQTYVQSAPLNTRGWVLQERCLARRQLNFARNQIFWECQELIACEQFKTGMPVGYILRKPTLYHNDSKDLKSSWTNLIRIYSESTLTRSEDKMAALAGLADQYRLRTQDVYLAGLWREDLVHQLLWTALKHRGSRRIDYLAPTWSWVSVQGPINPDLRASYSVDDLRDSKCLDTVNIYDTRVKSTLPEATHSFTEGYLKCKGFLQNHKIRKFETTYGILAERGDGPEVEDSVTWIDIDDDDSLDLSQEETHNCAFLLIRLEMHKGSGFFNLRARGLVLDVYVDGEEKMYKRLGTFRSYFSSKTPLPRHSAITSIKERLDIPNLDDFLHLDQIDFDDPRLADLVSDITIV